MRVTKPATPANLALFLTLVDVLVDEHGLAETSRGDLRLLAEEACTNVVMHAYPRGAPGDLTLELDYADGVATITLEDEGVPFRPADPVAPVDPSTSSQPEAGVGWSLIRALSDELHYERSDGRNRLTLRKRALSGA